jgi:dipeptidyl aminopeptidase/acylaminoacyl peptidase
MSNERNGAVAADVAPYGSWRSPITAELISAGSVRLGAVSFDGDDLYWLESRPTDAGRNVLMRRASDGAISEVTPPDTNVRTLVHEYGGGAHVVQRGTLFFSNFTDQRLYRQDRGDDPLPITAEADVPRGLRFADARVTPDGRMLVCVRERHAKPHDTQPVNELVTLPTDGSAPPRVVATGRDFYSSPRVGAGGTAGSGQGWRIAWLEWDHPNMPWDGTELWVADLARDGSVSHARRVAGGREESIFQPEWELDGALHFVSDRGGWWNLYRLDDLNDGEAVNLAPMEAEFGTPHWAFGLSQYAFLSNGRIACVINQNGIERLGIIAQGSGRVRTFDLPFNTFAYVASDGSSRVACLAGGTTIEPSVVLLDANSGTFEIVRRTNDADIDPGYISPAQPIEFPTGNGLTAHAFFYPPANRDVIAPSGELPPLVVFSHGGPTGATAPALDLSIQFWTSRGVAIVDVNYGGSTGYGRAYRQRLNGNWGIVDVADCVNAARYLVGQGLVDGNRLAIRGGSAGGYTTLAALTFTDVFHAGASYFGISDLETLASDTHKFESRYLDNMIGPYPVAKAIYEERSPIHFTDRLSSPMIILQGLEDAVVPPSQAEEMVAALKAKGLPHAYLPFEGEQHGFRMAPNIKRSLEAELYFYGRIFGFQPADDIEPVPIENL